MGLQAQVLSMGRSRVRIMASTLVEEETETVVAGSQAGNAPSTSGRPAGSRWVIDPNEQLTSTWEHRVWTWGPMAVMAAICGVAASQVSSPGDVAGCAVALAASYLLSDLGTGIYHWSVDNYGSGETPMFGRQIAAFQGHHQRPWTITQREFCNNLHQVFKPAAYPAAALLLASPFLPPAVNAFTGSFLWLVCMSQQFHAFSHMKKSELPAVVVALQVRAPRRLAGDGRKQGTPLAALCTTSTFFQDINLFSNCLPPRLQMQGPHCILPAHAPAVPMHAAQDAGLLIGRKEHGAHHKPNFEGNYCIVSGLWNAPLDNAGFFRWLEHRVLDVTGGRLGVGVRYSRWWCGAAAVGSGFLVRQRLAVGVRCGAEAAGSGCALQWRGVHCSGGCRSGQSM